MKRYFYNDGTNRFGPCSIEELKAANIKPTTEVWENGMENWTAAINVEELKHLFEGGENTPPPFTPNNSAGNFNQNNSNSYNQPQRDIPPTHLVWSILTTILCCMPLGIVAIIYSSKVETAYNRGDYKMALKYSNDAKNFSIASLIVGAVTTIIVIILQVASVISLGAW